MKRTDMSLLEQMQISDVEISRRMELLGLDGAALELLAAQRTLVEQNIDDIVDEFYEAQTAVDEISLLIGDAETLMRLRSAQRMYVIDLFQGIYDSEYVNNRLRIGMVHKRIGVEPKLYLAAVRTLKEIIFRVLSAAIRDLDERERTLAAVDKLLYFDTTLVFDTYIDSMLGEIEAAKNRTEIYARSLEEKVAERTRQLEDLAKKDPLTGAYNQRAMQELARREIAVARRHQRVLSLVYLDIDNFKAINDSKGHVEGDQVLRHLARSMIDNSREIDIACRYGGDEFCLILPECDGNNARSICEKVITGFNRQYPDYSLSMGVSTSGPEHHVSIDELVRSADQKMYQAKEHLGSQIRN